MSNENRDNVLDLIKVVLTILIIFHHYQQLFDVNFDNGINFFGGGFYFGYLVEFFFIISGIVTLKYVDMMMEGKIAFKSFIKKKFLSFIPLLAITSLVFEILLKVYYLLLEQQFMGCTPNLFGTIVTSIGIQAGWVFDNPMINNPVWYISVLLLCYIVFYLSMWISKKLGVNYVYLFVLIILLGIGIKTYGINLPFMNNTSARGYIAFFTGLLFAVFTKNKKPNRKIIFICVIITILIPILIINKPSLVSWNQDLLLVFIYYPSVVIVLEYSFIRRLINIDCSQVAKISYNAFMWHICTIMMFSISFRLLNLDASLFNSYITMFVFTIFCYVIGTLSYYFIDKPIIKLISSNKTGK